MHSNVTAVRPRRVRVLTVAKTYFSQYLDDCAYFATMDLSLKLHVGKFREDYLSRRFTRTKLWCIINHC